MAGGPECRLLYLQMGRAREAMRSRACDWARCFPGGFEGRCPATSCPVDHSRGVARFWPALGRGQLPEWGGGHLIKPLERMNKKTQTKRRHKTNDETSSEQRMDGPDQLFYKLIGYEVHRRAAPREKREVCHEGLRFLRRPTKTGILVDLAGPANAGGDGRARIHTQLPRGRLALFGAVASALGLAANCASQR